MDGSRIETSVRMYKLLVRPILEYGAQVLIYIKNFIVYKSSKSVDIAELTAYAKKLDNFQTKFLKRLLNCPRYGPPTIVRLFAGVEPIAARLDFLKLRYFWRLSNPILNQFLKKFMILKRGSSLVLTKAFYMKFSIYVVSTMR